MLCLVLILKILGFSVDFYCVILAFIYDAIRLALYYKSVSLLEDISDKLENAVFLKAWQNPNKNKEKH